MIKHFLYDQPFMLFPHEKIIFKTNPHWMLIVLPTVFFVVLWFLYLFLICPFLVNSILNGICFVLSTFAFPFVILIFYLDWRFNTLYLTNFRLVKGRGIIGKRFMSIFLEQVEDITCSYGILGRIFHFGDLEIESAGTYGKMVFKGIPSPKGMKWRIEWEIRKINK